MWWPGEEWGDLADFNAMSIKKTGLDDMPPEVIARIASHTMDVPLEQIEEVRACNCLGQISKPFPFRAGDTHFAKDWHAGSDIRCDVGRCALDARGGLGPWCPKQFLARAPGKKHPIPNFAAVNKSLYKGWRHATAYVFCCEACMSLAILDLPRKNVRMITRARFYERSNDINIENLSRETYRTGVLDAGRKTELLLVYETKGNQLVEYRGSHVWVKELVLTGDEV